MTTTEGHVSVDEGVELFFRKDGEGPDTLIVLNGFYLFDDFAYLAEGRTVIFLDLRNRGRSSSITDPEKLKRGVLNDIDDIDAVRRHFGADCIDLLGHSYAGKTVVLYAIRYPAHTRRVVQIGAMQPDEGTKYPARLTNVDATLQEFFGKMAQFQQEARSLEPVEACRRFWKMLRPIYVVDPDKAEKLQWETCDLPNERNLMPYWVQHLLPSIQAASPTAEDFARVIMPVLTIHGSKDRSSPYGGARDWAARLPNARLLTVENTAHAPWIEAPEQVLEPLRVFLDGAWPEEAEELQSIG